LQQLHLLHFQAPAAQLVHYVFQVGVAGQLKCVVPIGVLPGHESTQTVGQHTIDQLELHVAGGEAIQQILCRIQRNQPPLLEHGDAPTKTLGLFQIVGREYDGVPVFVQAADKAPERTTQLHIDARGRLVEDDDGGFVHQRLCDQHTPFHAAGEPAHVGIRLGGQIEVMHDLVDPVAVVSNTEITGLKAQRLTHAEEWIEHQLLRHHPERASCLPVIAHNIEAHHPGRASIRSCQAGEDADQRRLAGTVRPE